MSDITFAEGIWFNRGDNAPDYIVGNIEFDMAKFLAFADSNHKQGKLRLVVKVSKAGKRYIAVDTWEPTRRQEPQQQNGAMPPPQAPPPPFPEDEPIDDVPW